MNEVDFNINCTVSTSIKISYFNMLRNILDTFQKTGFNS